MGFAGFVAILFGIMLCVTAANGRLQNVIAAFLGQTPPGPSPTGSQQGSSAGSTLGGIAGGLLGGGGVIPPVGGGDVIDNPPTLPPVYEPPGGWDYST